MQTPIVLSKQRAIERGVVGKNAALKPFNYLVYKSHQNVSSKSVQPIASQPVLLTVTQMMIKQSTNIVLERTNKSKLTI